MATFQRDIALTHTPTTHQICIPAFAVHDMGIEEDKRIQVIYDNEKKEITIKKIKGA